MGKSMGEYLCGNSWEAKHEHRLRERGAGMQQTVDRGTMQRLGTVANKKTLRKLDTADGGYIEKATTEIKHGLSWYNWPGEGRQGDEWGEKWKGTSGGEKDDRRMLWWKD